MLAKPLQMLVLLVIVGSGKQLWVLGDVLRTIMPMTTIPALSAAMIIRRRTSPEGKSASVGFRRDPASRSMSSSG
jgi:hypothetical protein